MKPLSLLLLLTPLCAPVHAGEAHKPPRCINTHDITNAEVVDDYTILFHMAGGRIWKNTMTSRCPDLGFMRSITYETWGGEICANQQVIHVMYRATACVLGPFETYVPPPKKGDTSSNR